MQASTAKNETRLPRAVLRRSQAIEEHLKAQRESKADPAAEPPPPAPPSDPPAPPVAAATPPTPAPPPADARENDPKYWEQRFRATAGVLDTVKRERTAERESMQQRFDELQTQIRELQAKAPTAKLDLAGFFTADQIEKFGEEQCEAMAIAANKAAQDSVHRAIEAEVKPLREQRQRDQAQVVEDRKAEFKEKLSELVPDYAEIDVDPTWLAWLAQRDGDTGMDNGEILHRHIGKFDVTETAKVFARFKASKAPAPAAPVPPVTTAPAASPGPSESPPASAAAAKGAPTNAEVKEFYKREALGKVKDQERIEFDARLKLRGRQ